MDPQNWQFHGEIGEKEGHRKGERDSREREREWGRGGGPRASFNLQSLWIIWLSPLSWACLVWKLIKNRRRRVGISVNEKNLNLFFSCLKSDQQIICKALHRNILIHGKHVLEGYRFWKVKFPWFNGTEIVVRYRTPRSLFCPYI